MNIIVKILSTVSLLALIMPIAALAATSTSPPYVTYTYTRSDSESLHYTYEVWLRTSDGAAMERQVTARGLGPMEHTHPAWRLLSSPCGQENLADPSPLDVALPTAQMHQAAASQMAVIATESVTLVHRTDTLVRCDDTSDYRTIYDRIDVTVIDGVPVMKWLFGIAPAQSFASLVEDSTVYTDSYTFRDYAFPVSLPACYFTSNTTCG